MRLITLIILVSTLGIFGCEKKETVTVTEIVIQEPPEPVSRPVTVNVEASILSGSFLVDGQPASNSPYLVAHYYLKQSNGEEFSLLGESHDLEYEVMVINGSYEVYYEHIQGASIPANVGDLLPATVDVNADLEQDIDIQTHTVRGNFTLNGSAFPSSPYDKGVFYLQPTTGGDLIEFGYSNKNNDPVTVLSGTYHVLWNYIQGSTVPINQMTRVMSDVIISSDTGLNVDVQSTAMRVAITLNGAAFPDSAYEVADFYLISSSNEETLLGKSFDVDSIVNIIPDTYDLQYRVFQGGEVVPINAKSIVLSDHDATQPMSADVQTVNFSLTATLNNSAFSQSQYSDGILELHDPQTGSFTHLGKTWSDIENVILISGIYDIAYSHDDGATVPQNTRAIVAQNIDATSDAQEAIDVAGYNITGNITLDGDDFPFNQYDAANIILRGANSAADIVLFETFNQQDPIMVLPGTYDVIYSCQSCSNIPFNTDAVIIESLDISADTEIALDLESVRIEVFSTLNGGAFPDSPYADGVIWGGLGNTDRIFMGRTTESQADILVIAGEYNFWYQVEDSSGNSVPINEWELVDQQVIEN